MKKLNGFTLIEILIALTIFAILASLTSSALYNAYHVHENIQNQTKRLSDLQLCISLIQKDCLQAVERGIRTQDMLSIPAFIGKPTYFELTRDGNVNPKSFEKRSTLKRITLLCMNHQLIRRTWAALDAFDRKAYADKVLLDNLRECHFDYLNQNLQLFPEWRPEVTTTNQHPSQMPRAVKMTIKLDMLGEASFLFMIPGGIYAAP